MILDYQHLSEKLKQPLPGSLAHEPLRAVPIGLIKPRFDHGTAPKPGGVMILLYEVGGTIKFPLTKRPDYLGTHGGQISLPGGKSEPGESMIDTALRETEEEIGVVRSSIEVIGTLSEFFVIPSNFMVTPVVGYMKAGGKFNPDPKEVEKIIHGSLSELILPDSVKTKEIIAAKMFPLMAPHFEIEGEVVWGATAMILNEFRMVVRGWVLTNKQDITL